MQDNKFYFKYSLEHKETLLDKYYFCDEVILTNESNELRINAKKLSDLINEYALQKEFYKNKHQDMPEIELDSYLNEIMNILDLDNMNLTAFAQSFAIFDASFSMYDGLSKKEKIYFLSQILDAFVSTRMKLYEEIGDGYLQILYDSHAHKRMGSFGWRKTASQLSAVGYKQIYDINLKNKQFFIPDQVKKDKYLKFLHTNDIKCRWTKSKQNKMPDAVFMVDNVIYIVEHKHIKEGGGGQDKQLTEILDLISQNEDNVSYISYMDGLYFNELINPKQTVKIATTRDDIDNALDLNPKNYFVNTQGFEKILKDLLKK